MNTEADKKDSPPCAETDKEISLGIVGLGKMGLMHAAMASACPGVRVGALVDVDPKLGAHVQSIGVGAPFYLDLKEAAAKEGLDGVVIATPTHTHAPLIEAAYEAGLDILCEKPLAGTAPEAERLALDARERTGLCTAVAFMKGHQELFLSTAQLLRAGVLGEVRRFRASVYLSQVFSPKSGWTFTKESSGGGVLINTGIHLIHLCSLLFGRVTALTCRARPMHSTVEDTLTAILEFDGGVFGSVDMSWSIPGYDVEYTRIVAEGSNGVMDLDDFRRRFHLLQAWTLEDPWTELPKGLSVVHQSQCDKAAFTLTPDYCGEGYYNEMADFVESIRTDTYPRYTFDDGYQIQRIVEGLYQSAQRGGWLALRPPAGMANPRL